MRIPKLNNRSRTGLLGLGMFLVALSTAAEYASSVETGEGLGVPHTASVELNANELDAHECRGDSRNRTMARLQQL